MASGVLTVQIFLQIFGVVTLSTKFVHAQARSSLNCCSVNKANPLGIGTRPKLDPK